MDKSGDAHSGAFAKNRMNKVKREVSEFMILLCPKQKKTALMKNIEQKFTKAGNLVVDACSGTFSVVKAFMPRPKQRRFIGCKVNSICVTGAMP